MTCFSAFPFRTLSPGVCVMVLFLHCTSCIHPEPRSTEGEKLATFLGQDEVPRGLTYQAWFGVSRFDDKDQELERRSNFDPSLSAEPNFSTMPLVGFALQHPLARDVLTAGGEGGFTLGWWADGEEVRNASGATLLDIDAELLTLEFFLGGYASADLGRFARIYAGAGPLLLLGLLDTEVEEIDPGTGILFEDDESDVALGAGVYVRAGLEFAISESSLIGFGVRKIDVDLDFGSPPGKLGLDGVQFLFTWALRF